MSVNGHLLLSASDADCETDLLPLRSFSYDNHERVSKCVPICSDDNMSPSRQSVGRSEVGESIARKLTLRMASLIMSVALSQ